VDLGPAVYLVVAPCCGCLGGSLGWCEGDGWLFGRVVVSRWLAGGQIYLGIDVG
jgi:hypothetical protein